jgi:type IV pilus assembly protein PilM
VANKVASLYLEDNGIRLLTASGRQVEKWITIPLEPGLVSGGVIQDENKVADKIRETFLAIRHVKGKTKSGLKKWWSNMFGGSSKLIIGLNGRDSLYRVVALPVLPEAALGEAVYREAGRVLPVSLDELYIAYQRIPGFANETRIFVAAFPKKTTDTLLKTLRIAGITPRYLDLAPLALCLSVNEPRSIIVDVRQDNLNLIIMANRVPQVIRSLALQSEEKVLSENLPTIAEEFSRTVAFYNSTHQQEPLDSSVPVCVSSDLANAKDDWKTLVGKLDSPISVLPAAMQYPGDFPANEFAVNLGLATKELGLEKDETANYSLVNLNALPSAMVPKQFNAMRVAVPVAAAIGVAGLVLLWMNWQTHIATTTDLEGSLAATQTVVQRNAGDIGKLTEQNRLIEGQIQPMLDYTAVFNGKMDALQGMRMLMDSDLHQTVELKPGAVSVTALIHSGTNMLVHGSSSRQADVLGYAQAIRDTGGFTVIVTTISYSQEITETGEVLPAWDFAFQMK